MQTINLTEEEFKRLITILYQTIALIPAQLEYNKDFLQFELLRIEKSIIQRNQETVKLSNVKCIICGNRTMHLGNKCYKCFQNEPQYDEFGEFNNL